MFRNIAVAAIGATDLQVKALNLGTSYNTPSTQEPSSTWRMVDSDESIPCLGEWWCIDQQAALNAFMKEQQDEMVIASQDGDQAAADSPAPITYTWKQSPKKAKKGKKSKK